MQSTEPDDAGVFTLEFIGALVRKGYYSPDHPEAVAAARRLYECFVEVTPEGREVSYQILSPDDTEGLVLHGLRDETVELARACPAAHGRELLARFHELFLKNRMAAFTLKRGVGPEEFETFLGLWVGGELERAEPATSPAQAMSDELARRGILNVSILGIDELIGGGRKLSFPVMIALTRMNKDLTRLPLLQSTRPEGIADLKRLVIQEIVRPASRPRLLRDVVMNADLIAEGTGVLTRAEVEETIVGAMTPRAALGTGTLLLDTLEANSRGEAGATELFGFSPEETCSRLLDAATGVLTHLARADLEEAYPLLELAYGRALIPLDLLPEAVRRHIEARERTDRFLEQPEAFLAQFSACADEEPYGLYLDTFGLILPELLERGETAWLGRILALLHQHSAGQAPFPGCVAAIGEMLGPLERTGFPDRLLDAVTTVPDAEREPLELGVALFRTAMVPRLVQLLGAAERPSAWQAACNMLLRVGEAAVPLLADQLATPRPQAAAVRGIVQVLGELGVADAVSAILLHAHHPEPPVRAACLKAVRQIQGAGAEASLLRFLSDRDGSLLGQVVRHLGELGSTAPRFYVKVTDLVRLRTRAEEEPAQDLQAACLRALAAPRRGPGQPPPALEAALIEVVRPPRLKQLLPGDMGVRAKPPALLALAAMALGALGTEQAAAPLRRLGRAKQPEVRQAAEQALEALEARHSGQ